MIQRERNGEDSVSFDYHAFHTVMSMYGQQGFPARAEAMLDEVCPEPPLADVSKQGAPPKGNSTLLSSYSFLTVINAWIKANNPERAEAILRRMCRCRDQQIPHVRLFPQNFIVVAACWNKSQQQQAGVRADDLLQLMELENVDAKNFELPRGIYVETMKNLASVGEGERAEALLRRVQPLFRKGSRVYLSLYRDVIHAWRQSQDPRASERIASLEAEITDRFPKRPMSSTSNS